MYVFLGFFFKVNGVFSGIVGGGVGLVSKHRKIHGLSNISATYATNFAIVTGCYCGNVIANYIF